MPNKSSKITVIIGAQWGDEGKGKITDFFAGEADFVVRFHGGNNAGHTVIVNDNTFKLHLIPSVVYINSDLSPSKVHLGPSFEQHCLFPIFLIICKKI